jgi:hypothetical protein
MFDLTPYLDDGVFRERQDPYYFRRVGILFGAVTWPNDQDITPATLIAEIAPVANSFVPGEIKIVVARPAVPALSPSPFM